LTNNFVWQITFQLRGERCGQRRREAAVGLTYSTLIFLHILSWVHSVTLFLKSDVECPERNTGCRTTETASPTSEQFRKAQDGPSKKGADGVEGVQKRAGKIRVLKGPRIF